MPSVGIVTDSTCDMDPEELQALGVEMVPLKVLFGDETFLDWIDLPPARFFSKLAESKVFPKTSQPSPADFLEVYGRLADQGCDSIVSIHLSAALSGTYQSASLAAQDSPIPVHVIDSRKVTQGVALMVQAAVEARDEGLSGEAVAARLEGIADSMTLLFVLDTLEYLVKGGRAGKAAGLAASLLNIKPVLEVNSEGAVEPFKKVKGRKKALVEIAHKVAEDAAEKGRLRLALLHACTQDCGDDLRTAIEQSGADVEIVRVGLVGAVIGTYSGPDAVGCAYYPIG